ncbi:hypothetical protein [Paenibacillus medicaginis]|uniref:Uncharacterized protein n=1 Tax=Paenibacillus medicaginis TaxID=1470560 RepID=A0ABV5BV69_9BACL
MKNGTKVMTNDDYYNKYGRRIFGVVESEIDSDNETVTCIQVMNQQGRVIPEHQEKLVIMMIDDLEIVYKK